MQNPSRRPQKTYEANNWSGCRLRYRCKQSKIKGEGPHKTCNGCWVIGVEFSAVRSDMKRYLPPTMPISERICNTRVVAEGGKEG